ncbi:hypothetical protein [Bernardetia sp.]|uniref:hypothetical protein n=1 Tax=Bernardetia sp. TaxID=1937974 RepID=UPI0025C47631|nr:hypothetical protein [Bernardetia sp.]
MNKYILTIVSVSFLMLSFFHTNKKSIVGLYGKCGKSYMACTQIDIKEDSTFEYYVFYDVGGASIKKGNWKVSKDTLILNTFNQPKFERGYHILDSSYSDIKEIYFLDRDSIPLHYNTVVINQTDSLFLDANGIAKYKLPINDVQIFGLNGQKNTFTIKTENYSKIVFFVDDFICHSQDYLTNEKLLIENNSLKPYYHCHNKFADKGLKKTSIKNKAF